MSWRRDGRDARFEGGVGRCSEVAAGVGTPAKSVAPTGTASLGLASTATGRLSSLRISCEMYGMRDDPPTSTTVLMSAELRWAPASARPNALVVAASVGRISASK